MINSRIIGTLAKHVSPALKQELEEDMLAADAWRMLKSRMHQEGIFAKLNAMHTALRTKFSFSTPTLDTLAELKKLTASIYEGGRAPTRDEWAIVLMLNALKDTDYEPLHIQLLTCFQEEQHTLTQKSVYDAIAFAGYEHKRKSMEQANIAKSQKEPRKGKKTCSNPNCKAPRQHATKDCWYEGRGSAHKAPEWFKELQARRKHEKENTTWANVAQESKATPESANITAEHLIDHLEDGYES